MNSIGVTAGSSASDNLGGAPRSLDTPLASHARAPAATVLRARAISHGKTRTARWWRMAYLMPDPIGTSLWTEGWELERAAGTSLKRGVY
jgi:hypothetical protein